MIERKISTYFYVILEQINVESIVYT